MSSLSGRAIVSEIAIKNIERGASDPRLSTVNNIQEAFDRAGVIFLDTGDIRDGGPGLRLKRSQCAGRADWIDHMSGGADNAAYRGQAPSYHCGRKKDPSLIVVFDEERTLIFEEFDAPRQRAAWFSANVIDDASGPPRSKPRIVCAGC